MFSPEAEPQLLKRAKDFLQAMIDLVPNHPLANYNLACAHSLLGELQEGVDSLKRAIEGGYSNLKHMLEDADLENLRKLPEFGALADMLKRKEKEPEKPAEPEPVKEEVKVEVTVEKAEEPKKEEVKVEVTVEKVEEPKRVPSKWENQLQTLAGMGFTNTDVNEVLLAEFKGDMMKVINALLFSQ
jgi:outer membrane biosynthesis protein TonB